MTPDYISHETARSMMSWTRAVEALREGHLRPRAEVADTFIGPGTATLLTRSAFIAGLGYGVKAVTVMDDNKTRALPTVQGAMMFYEPDAGAVRAIIESRLITEIKTASDSLLGARLLARPDSKRLLIVGAGVVAESLASGYPEIFPGLEQVAIWARRPEQAEELLRRFQGGPVEFTLARDLAEAAARADIISTATMAREPLLHGDWVSPGTHVDLIGAFKADMREADDALISGGSLFVDSRDTTITHIGELMVPLAAGIIRKSDVKADFYDLIAAEQRGRRSDGEITVFKNGGGAHLDLMIADYIVQTLKAHSE